MSDSDFDVDAYYAEQDEWMNIPNETVDEYLKRLSSLRRGPGSMPYSSSSRMPHTDSSMDQDKSKHGKSTASSPRAERDCAAFEPGQIVMSEHTTDFGRTLKRKAEDQEIETDHNHKKIADQIHSKEVDQSRRSVSPIYAKLSDREMPSTTPMSAEVEEIDSFTVELTDSQIPNKRKTPLKHVRPNPRKKKLSAGTLGPQISLEMVNADHSPISYFSKTREDIAIKRSTIRNDIVAFVPPLDLRPIHQASAVPPAPKAKKGEVDYESPIEDASMNAVSQSSPKKEKRLEAEPSEMYLEMKERMAMHSKRDKVLKLQFKPIPQDPTTSVVPNAAHHHDKPLIIYISSSPSSRASSPGPTKPSASKKMQGVKEKPKPHKPMVVKRAPKGKGKKEKPEPMTPVDYAKSLQPSAVDETSGDVSGTNPTALPPKLKGRKSVVLAGKNIVYLGGDMRHASESTRGRMDIIVRNGGNLMPEYDPNITTHIIVEASEGAALRALGLRNIRQIASHIPTVRWTWVLKALDLVSRPKDVIDRKLGDYSAYAAFADRIDAGCPLLPPMSSALKLRSKWKTAGDRPDGASTSRNVTSTVVTSDNAGTSGSSTPTPPVGAPPSPPASPLRSIIGPPNLGKATTSRVPAHDHQEHTDMINDSLSDTYDQAGLQRDDGWSSFGEGEGIEWPDGKDETDDDDDSEPVHKIPAPKKGFNCDKKELKIGEDCPNQDIIDKLTELMSLHNAKQGTDDKWRAVSYQKAIPALRSYPRRIKSFQEARRIKGVGNKTAHKIVEILETGELQRIKYETTKDVEVTRLFQGIYGVGQSIAYQWYSAGCRTLADLKSGKGGIKLTHVQEIGLRFYEDINERMPRTEAKAIFDLIKPIALSIDPRLVIDIMGSYRRGKADCGDIDILITRPIDDEQTHMGVMSRLLQKLHAAHILTEDLALPDDPYSLESTYRGLCRLRDGNQSRRRRIDILCVPWQSRGAALLYYTGDDIFNRAIRLKANVLGYSLNQRGLFGKVVRDPRDRRIKLNAGVLVASETEEEIFKILGVPWQEPHERVRG